MRAYHIADAHNRRTNPIAAANTFGEFDLLILNGDVIDHSGDPSKFDNVYDICSRLTCGSKPVVFSRGNHDMRGNYAERFADYTPNANGNTYYTFRLGGLWGILLDCGEDKLDSCDSYGYTICCHQFRQRQTAFLRRVIENKEREYSAEGVTHRVVISHVPFTTRFGEPFNIEEDTYTEWARLLREEVKPDVMICGHVHQIGVWERGGAKDSFGQPCPVVVGSRPEKERWLGCGFTFGKNDIKVTFTDSTGAILDEKTL
ncbi:MAG: metallophosphoesterase [Clostridia bacterium]|nr:metallophosphoesterase [Clostridia bacterium]